MANEICDHLTIHVNGGKAKSNEMLDYQLSVIVEKKLRGLSPIPSDRSIHKVPEHLRKVNKEAYEPQILAIGPYHRGKAHLKAMEEHKLRYLNRLLQRREEDDVKKYISAMRFLEARARKCYAETINLKTNEFVEMMLLDSCFIVELLRKYIMTKEKNIEDPIFQVDWMGAAVARDLLLVENQLPFFVILEFFGMTGIPLEQNHLSRMIASLFDRVLPKGYLRRQYIVENENSIHSVKHIVGLLHHFWLPKPSEVNEKWEFIRSATELRKAGIKFKKVEGDRLFHIKFENGILKIPRLEVADRTESLFRNLIAYEQFYMNESFNYVTSYIAFMKSLINLADDVEYLCQCGIIDNWLGDDEVVANMFNRLFDAVVLSPEKFYYSKLCNDVNGHWSKIWNQWMAILRRKYFNTPWAFISFIAGVVLLLLTVAQTVYTISPPN